MNQNQNLSDRRKKERRAHRAYAALVCVLTMTAVMTVPALAADAPVSVVTIAGGIVITFAKEILTLITGG